MARAVPAREPRSRLDPMNTTVPAPTKNKRLLAWVHEVAQLTEPDQIQWCDGSAEEYDRLCQELVDAAVEDEIQRALMTSETRSHSASSRG